MNDSSQRAPARVTGTVGLRAVSGVAGCLVALSLVSACGAPQAKVESTPRSASDAGIDASAEAERAKEAPPERPLANTTQEAVTLINDAIEAKSSALWTCVEAYRVRKNDPGAKVAIKIGIDQEGTIIALVIAKPGQGDKEAVACMDPVLKSAPFPRSHAGVISIVHVFDRKQVNP